MTRTSLSLCLLILSMAAGPLVGQAIVLENSDLFVARQGGYHTYRIPGMVVTVDGTLLAYAAARNEDIWDYGNYDTVLRRSTDGGKTWGPTVVFVDAGTSTVDNCIQQCPDPICFGSLLAVPREVAGQGGVLLFSNPDNTVRSVDIGPAHYCDRKNVTVRLSLNDGTDWVKSVVVESGFSGYSDLCIAPDGTIYCLYERGSLTSYYDPAAIALARLGLRPWLAK